MMSFRVEIRDGETGGKTPPFSSQGRAVRFTYDDPFLRGSVMQAASEHSRAKPAPPRRELCVAGRKKEGPLKAGHALRGPGRKLGKFFRAVNQGGFPAKGRRGKSNQ